jgi:hypothetical protein
MFQRPPRLSIVNLDHEDAPNSDPFVSFDRIDAQFNPEEFTLAISAVYKDQVIPGMSHSLKQFTHTKNLALTFDLHFHVYSSASNTDRFPSLAVWERKVVEGFLLSLCVPGGAAIMARTRPPRVLVVWPQCLTFEGIVDDVTLKYTRFNVHAEPVELTATLKMEELRDFRYTTTGARSMGLSRGRVI